MTTPATLSGVTSSLKIDGVDMHSFGMLVADIDNPVPNVKPSQIDVAGIDGVLDFSKNYQARYITIKGKIVADNQTQLLANIDSIQSTLRLREDLKSFLLVFQNQTDRYWTCRYTGQFPIKIEGVWRKNRIANYSLRLFCVKPYAEATAVTTETVFMTQYKHHLLSNTGTVRSPLSYRLRARIYPNILESVAGDASEDNTLWTLSNCTGTNEANAALIVYGAAAPRLTQVAGGAYYAEIDITAQITTTKNYVLGAWLRGSTAPPSHVSKLQAIMAGATDQEATYSSTVSGYKFEFLKLTAAQLTGMTAIKFRLYHDGTDAVILIDGCFAYEITAAEAADSDYFPPPYMTEPTGDDYLPPKNPNLTLMRNINLYPQKNGEAVQGTGRAAWRTDSVVASVSVVTDPLAPEKQNLLVAGTDLLTNPVFSPYVFTTGGKVLQVSMDTLIEVLGSGNIFVVLVGYDENGTALDNIATEQIYVSDDWTTVQFETEIPDWASQVSVEISSGDDVDVRGNIRDIMLVEVAATGGAYSSYVEPDPVEQSITIDALNEHDIFEVNNERLTALFADFPAASANGMQYFDGDRITIEPGSNYLRYTDARAGTQDPEAQSCGACYVDISYRKRYL